MEKFRGGGFLVFFLKNPSKVKKISIKKGDWCTGYAPGWLHFPPFFKIQAPRYARGHKKYSEINNICLQNSTAKTSKYL